MAQTSVAQIVTAMGGGSASSTTYSVSVTIGQAVIGDGTNGSTSVSLGYWSGIGPTIGGCCAGRVGDANDLGGDDPTLGDVATMIDAKYIDYACAGNIPCLQEADINQSGGSNPTCDDITLGDIMTLIDYLFITGSSLGLPNCL